MNIEERIEFLEQRVANLEGNKQLKQQAGNELLSSDGRFIAIQQNDADANHPHGNFVIYKIIRRGDVPELKPVWDAWSVTS